MREDKLNYFYLRIFAGVKSLYKDLEEYCIKI